MTAEPISVYIDNNVWDFLFQRGINLAEALPKEEFRVYITREAEFEITAIPEHKARLKAFIQDTIDRCTIKPDRLLGFYDDDYPADEQRFGSFEDGRWVEQEELEFIQQRPPLTGKKRKTKLLKKEADNAVAARAFTGIVLSLDAKKGPINDAYRQGGKVVFLTDFDNSGLSLSEFIKRAIMVAQGT